METLKQQMVGSHIRENYPNARIQRWDDPDAGLQFYTAQQLQEVEGDWFPLCCYRNREGQTVYGGRAGVVHTYTEGETGAGKTSRFAMQSIRALSATKGKPSFVVVDIHGELVENLYAHLRDGGYDIRILNCDEPSRSDTYNPFAPLVRQCLQTGKLTNELLNQIRRIAEIMQPVETADDPIWDQGARSYTNGLILDKFEDLLEGKIPPSCITIYNIIEGHYWLRRSLGDRGDLQRLARYGKKPNNALSVQKMMSVTNNAEKTRASYFGVAENHFDAFGQTALYQLSSNSTIDIDSFVERPTAIFIQSGTTRVGDDLISLLMNEIYNTAVRIGRKSPTKMLPRKIHCFLDEFANSDIAEGPEFIRMLTTSRKFGMYWHMLLQCDAQLERKFDTNTGRIIRANCTEIFMGSHDHETMVRFARSCGQKTVESLASLVPGQTPALSVVDLITADKLNLTPEGWVYIKTNRRPLMYSYIEAFFKCPEFQPVADIQSLYPVNDFDYTQTAFYPDDVPGEISATEYRIIQVLMTYGELDTPTLHNTLPDKHVYLWLEVMLSRDLVCSRLGEDKYSSNINPRAYQMLKLRYPDIQVPPLVKGDESYYEYGDELVAAIVTRDCSALSEEMMAFDCIPREMIMELSEVLGCVEHDEFPYLGSAMLHYAIVRAFMLQNRFINREDCLESFCREYQEIKNNDLFPPEFMSLMDKALGVLKDLSEEELMQLREYLWED